MKNLVRVELGDNGQVVRIFRKDKKWLSVPIERVVSMDRGVAVGLIRGQVYKRSWNEGTQTHECEHCGRSINWTTMQMNEKQFKGKGGEVSLENCEALCADCHQGHPDSVHGDRRWQTSKLKGNDGPS